MVFYVITAKAGSVAVPSNVAEIPVESDRLAEELGVDMVKIKKKKSKGS